MVQTTFTNRHDPVSEQLGLGRGAVRAVVDLALDHGPDPIDDAGAEAAVDSRQEFESGIALMLKERIDALVATEVVEKVDADDQDARQVGLSLA